MDRVELVIELKGDQEALQKLRELQNLVNKLNGQKITPTVNSQPAETAIGKLKRLFQDTFNKDQKLNINSSAVDTANTKVNDLKNNFSALDDNSVALNVDASGITAAQSAVANLASALQGLSSLLSTVGGALTTTGGWLQGLSGMFGGDVLGTAGRTAIGYSTVMLMQGLGNSIGRFDTFRTFPRMMELMGYSAEDADRAIEKLNQAVLGTPTTLNDIMDVAKDFILLTGDIDKGTDIAIAANNAFLANASDAQSVYYGMRQLRDLFSKGGLREQEWDSLFSALGISIGVIGEEMGYTTQKVGEFKTGLKDGSVEVNDFINALVRAGNEGGKLADMADIGKDTLNATITNLKTAFSNLGAGVLQEFSDFLGAKTGKDLPATIKSISDAIKTDFIPAVRDWVSDNGDRILELLQKFADFDWKKLAGSIGDNALKLFEGIGKIFDFFGEDKVIEFISFATVWAGPLGKAMSLLGGLFTTAGQLFGTVGNGLGKGISNGTAGAVATTGYLGLVTELALGFKELAKAGQEISAGDFDNLATNLAKMKELIEVCGAIALAMTGVGSILTGLGAGWTVAGGEALAGGLVGLIGEIGLVLEQYVDVIKKLGDLSGSDMPDSEQIDKMLSTLGTFARGVGLYLIGTDIDKDTAQSLESILNIITTLHEKQDIFNLLDEIDIDFDSASESIGGLGDGLTGIIEKLNGYFGESGGVRTIQQKAKIIEGLGDVVTNINDISGKLSELEPAIYKLGIRLDQGSLDTNSAFGKLIGKMEGLVEGLNNVSNTISESGLDALFKLVKTKLENEVIQNYKDIVTSIFELTVTLDGTKPELSKLGIRTQNGDVEEGSAFGRLLEKIKAIVTGLESVSNVISESEIDALFKKIKTQLEEDIIQNYKDTVGLIQELATLTNSMDFGDLGLLEEKSPFEEIKAQIGALLTGISEVLSEVDSKLFSPKSWFAKKNSKDQNDIVENLRGAMGNLAEIVGFAKSTFDMLKNTDFDMLETFKEQVPELLSSLNEVLVDMDDNAVSASTKLGTTELYLQAMQTISDVLVTLSGMVPLLQDLEENEVTTMLTNMIAGLGIATDQIPEDMDEMIERVAMLSVVVESLGTMVETVAAMQEMMAEMRENEENVPEEVGGLLDQLIAMIGGIDFEEEDMDRFVLLTESITALDEALLTFMEGTLAQFLEQLQVLIEKINELTDPTIENLRQKEAETEEQTDDLKLAIEELGDMCDAKKPSVDALADSIVRLGEVAQSSAGMVRELAAAIDSLHDKTVTISVVMNTSGAGGIGLPSFAQNGGPIYRAGGGSVFFKPRGSDTVPAMLTPGEFVMRKTAVDKIGVPILSMLNSMNIPGAIDALIAKIHLPVSSGVVSYDNRRTYDNHATVNQYISTNNPAYTYRRASRFAHAL